MNKLNVVLAGRHANRTPMAYAEYRALFAPYCNFISDLNKADIVVLGFSVDLNGLAPQLSQAMASRPQIKVFVISEEPLWDTLSPNNINAKSAIWENIGFQIPFTVLNHVTSPIFNFEKIPYFLTTESVYCLRYAQIFKQRVEGFNAAHLLQRWHNATYRIGFLQQKRVEEKYDYEDKTKDLYGLSCYRTELALACQSEATLIKGAGWGTDAKRQLLPDWHLDKLTDFSNKVAMFSSLENTHVKNYITEKFVDTFAMGAVPLYWASHQHRINELAEPNSFINLYGLTVPEAATMLENIQFDQFDITAYEQTLNSLYTLFSNAENLHVERERVVWETMREIEAVIDN